MLIYSVVSYKKESINAGIKMLTVNNWTLRYIFNRLRYRRFSPTSSIISLVMILWGMKMNLIQLKMFENYVLIFNIETLSCDCLLERFYKFFSFLRHSWPVIVFKVDPCQFMIERLPFRIGFVVKTCKLHDGFLVPYRLKQAAFWKGLRVTNVRGSLRFQIVSSFLVI